MILTLNDITYEIGGLKVLGGVSGSIDRHECIALVGANGSGKSTLADIICGLRNPSSGLVHLGSDDLLAMSSSAIARRGVNRMFQAPRLAWNLTAVENIGLALASPRQMSWGCKNQGRAADKSESGSGIRRSAIKWLEKLGIANEADVPAYRLSYGQQRLLEFARTVARAGQLLILDEPFTGIKSASLQSVMNVLREEREAGRCAILIDHTLPVLAAAASRIWFLEGGTIHEFADMDHLISNKQVALTYVREKTEVETAQTTESPRRRTIRGQKATSLLLDDLSGGYPGNQVIDGVNLVVHRGDVLSIVGRNGSGKSTLFRLIAGLVRPNRGRVLISNANITDWDVAARIRHGLRLLPQRGRLFQSLSVADNISLSEHGCQWHLSEETLCDEGATLGRNGPWMWRPGVTQSGTFLARARTPVRCLSGGEQAQLALATLNVGTARVILLDEPTSGVDGAAKKELQERLLLWTEHGRTIVMVEHDLDFVRDVSTRVVLMDAGRLLELDWTDLKRPEFILEAILSSRITSQ